MKNRRLSWFVTISAMVVLLGAYLVTRNTRSEPQVESGASPGYGAAVHRNDDSKFELARPHSIAASTTIPGGAPALEQPDMSIVTTTMAAAASPEISAQPTGPGAVTPATTVVPPPPKPVPLPGIDDPDASTGPICGSFFELAQGGREVQNRLIRAPNAKLVSLRDLIVGSLDRAAQVLGGAVVPAPDLPVQQTLLLRIAEMRSLASQVRKVDDGRGVYVPLYLPQRQDEPAGWMDILGYLKRNCVEVPRSFGIDVA